MKKIKELGSLHASGYGNYMSSVQDAALGDGIYQVQLRDCDLGIFERGLSCRFVGERKAINYLDILHIQSYLSADVFSQASKDGNTDISLPLEIQLAAEIVVMQVQLLVYSRLLIALHDFWLVFRK